jgi:Tfp pilus assembly protein PilF
MKTLNLVLLALFAPVIAGYCQEQVNKDEVRELLGETYMISKDYNSAIEQYKHILQKNPGNTAVRGKLADIYSWQEKYELAINNYKQILTIEPANEEVNLKLAEVYFRNTDFEKAETVSKRILENNPENTKAKTILAECCVATDKINQAIKIYKTLLLKNNEETLQIKLAEAYISNEQYKEAKDLLKPIVESDPENIKAKLLLGKVFHYTGNPKKAAEIYKEILKQNAQTE